MKYHLFFTGEKGVGKSTLIRTILAGQTGKIGGFVTRKATDIFPGKVSLHLLCMSHEDAPSVNNFLFFCGGQAHTNCARSFDRLGCAALVASRDAALLVMDELGPGEEQASQFHQAVLDTLGGNIPVVGVLQKGTSPFLNRVATHPRVRLVEVTAQNRDTLLSQLRGLEWFHNGEHFLPLHAGLY